jgi:crotonobetainyl-CoA:carnitine CoA-transferase CaiB-like acyl-CoA transferase
MKALHGIRVVDLTRHMAGPYATQMLSDYGAEVIKVESLPHGDPSRRTGTSFVGDESGLFLIWNHGKRSFAVDMRQPGGLHAVQRLAATADVLIENYRPGVADKIGIGYEQLSAENPRLIYVSLSAFGSTGPWAADPGTDPVVQAMSGVMSVTGETDGEPLLIGVPVADFTGAMVAAQAAMLGLFAREKTGQGQRADVSMLHALMSSLTTRLASHWFGGETPGRHGNQHSVVAPYQAFKTADGHAVAGVWGAGEAWPRFCEAVGRPDLVEHPDFAENVDRVAHREQLNAILRPIFAEHTTAEWRTRFQACKALFGPILSIPEAVQHEQAQATGVVTSIEHDTLGTIPSIRPVIGLSETPGEIAGPPPLLGQHTAEILSELGYDAEQVQELIATGAAMVAEPAPVA